METPKTQLSMLPLLNLVKSLAFVGPCFQFLYNYRSGPGYPWWACPIMVYISIAMQFGKKNYFHPYLLHLQVLEGKFGNVSLFCGWVQGQKCMSPSFTSTQSPLQPPTSTFSVSLQIQHWKGTDSFHLDIQINKDTLFSWLGRYV